MSRPRDRVRVIGLGSPFGVDSVGWRVAQALGARLGVDPAAGRVRLAGREVEVEMADRPGTELLRRFDGACWVVLIDAALDGEGLWPRWLHREELRDLAMSCSSHDLGVAETLALGEVLGALPERLSILGIGVNPAGDPQFEASQWTRAIDQGVEMLLAALSATVGKTDSQAPVSA